MSGPLMRQVGTRILLSLLMLLGVSVLTPASLRGWTGTMS